MIFLDSSVVLARLFAEAASPADPFWARRFVSNRLLDYEVMNRVNSRPDVPQMAADDRAIIDRIELIELSPVVLARALAPFPVAVKTLDGLHLANGQTFHLASYDKRLVATAHVMGVAVETGL